MHVLQQGPFSKAVHPFGVGSRLQPGHVFQDKMNAIQSVHLPDNQASMSNQRTTSYKFDICCVMQVMVGASAELSNLPHICTGTQDAPPSTSAARGTPCSGTLAARLHVSTIRLFCLLVANSTSFRFVANTQLHICCTKLSVGLYQCPDCQTVLSLLYNTVCAKQLVYILITSWKGLGSNACCI